MAKKKLHDRKGNYTFFCPGCKDPHTITDNWKVDVDSVTVNPSVLVTSPRHYSTGEEVSNPVRCHSFVRSGKIQFLNDCNHSLKGQTVDLPEFEMDEDGGFIRPESM